VGGWEGGWVDWWVGAAQKNDRDKTCAVVRVVQEDGVVMWADRMAGHAGGSVQAVLCP
jgi:hypothetical protein